MVKERAQNKTDMKKIANEYNSTPRKKIKNSIDKKELEKFRIELTPKQHELYKTIRNNTITIIHGPAGTSKTFTACYAALKLLADKKLEKIILTKPIKESGEELGHLPGDVYDKTAPFMRSFFGNFEKMVDKKTLSLAQDVGEVLVEPLAYMRGVTYDDSIMLLDEGQNATMKQIMLWVTRLGKNSKAVLMGDISQYDIRKRDSKMFEFTEMVKNVNGVGFFEFTTEDIVRNQILIDIVNKYDEYKQENKN